MCIPSPAILHLVLAVRDEHFRLPAFYADEDDFMESLAAAYRKAIRAFYITISCIPVSTISFFALSIVAKYW